MAATKHPKPAKLGASTVDDYLRELQHPLKAEMQAIRAIILGASPKITEGIKWNAPSFATTEHFATFNPRTRDAVQVIFHLGAKAQDKSAVGTDVQDPAGLLEWLAKDRASLKLRDMKAIEAQGKALKALVLQWITHLPRGDS